MVFLKPLEGRGGRRSFAFLQAHSHSLETCESKMRTQILTCLFLEPVAFSFFLINLCDYLDNQKDGNVFEQTFILCSIL